ncbi:MAG: YihY/virulence factor BrkB family protein [Erysipelotrichales bacterium]|nr:YihY/virulence factor BrkB family protein [Erysipelotrichales bacterium]
MRKYQISKLFLIQLVKLTFKEYIDPKGTLVRNNIAFSILLSLAPIIALLSLFSLHILHTTSWVLDTLSHFIPPNYLTTFMEVGLKTSSYSFIPFLITLLFSYYTATRGFYALMLAFSPLDHEQLYDHRLLLTIHSIFTPLLFIFLVLLAVGSITLLQYILPNTSIYLVLLACFSIYQFLSLCFFYIMTYPRTSLSFLFPGSCFFALGLTGMGIFFFLYIEMFTNYQDIYGSITSMIVLLLSVNVISVLMYIGICIDRVYKQIKEAR